MGGGGGDGEEGGRKKAIYKSYKIYLVAHPEEVLIILVVDVMNKVSFDAVRKLWLHWGQLSFWQIANKSPRLSRALLVSSY